MRFIIDMNLPPRSAPGSDPMQTYTGTMGQQRTLHFEWSRALGASWVERVLSTLQQCSSPILRKRLVRWGKDRNEELTLGERGIALQTKLTMVPLIVNRIDARMQEIGTLLRGDRRGVEDCLRIGADYHLNDWVVYETVIDFDAFFFESRSAYELTISFLEQFFKVILGNSWGGNRSKAFQKVETELENRGAKTDWVETLRDARNLLIHNRALWLAFEVIEGDPFRFDPVLLTKSVLNHEDDDKRISIHECRNMWQGFVDSYEPIEKWLMDEIQKIDAAPDSAQT
jgi:hypothetical protein